MRIRGARLRAGLTQMQMAGLVDLSRASIANIEGGRQAPAVDKVFVFAEVLGVSPASFFAD